MTVDVRPRVGFGRSGRLFIAKVTSDLTYAGRYVWVQRKAPFGSFRNVEADLSRRELARGVPPRLPKGRSSCGSSSPMPQAGAGYVAEHEPPALAQRR